MQTAMEVLNASDYGPELILDTVTLDYESRHKRRMVLATDKGSEVLIDLPKARLLQDGDGLRLTDATGVIRICAAPEELLEVRGHDSHHLIRLAWHLGNRHLPAMIEGDRILIRQDHVIEKMLIGLGAHLDRITAPFNPERGAYHDNGGHDHGNDHGHDHAH